MRLVLACGHIFHGLPRFLWPRGGQHSVVLCPLGCGCQSWMDINKIEEIFVGLDVEELAA